MLLNWKKKNQNQKNMNWENQFEGNLNDKYEIILKTGPQHNFSMNYAVLIIVSKLL